MALDDAMQMGECFFTGHLLDGARLTRKDKVMIKTKAGSEMEIDVTNAMIELAPELEGEPGFPIGSSEPNVAARQGEEFMIQRGETYGKYGKKEGRDVHAVEFDNPFTNEPNDAEDAMSTMLEDFDPPEIANAAHEAFALHHKAKQRIMEVKKLRQYYRRPGPGPDPDERRRIIQEKMRSEPCHKCGELGHWSRECPQKHNATAVAAPKPSGSAQGTAEDEWATLVSLCHQQQTGGASAAGQYKERFVGVSEVTQVEALLCETLWCDQELRLRVILDLGCVKSVVGIKWMKELLEVWQSKGRWLKVTPESEQFQFGNGESLTSRYHVQFESIIAGSHVVLGMSVVSGKCPPLLSRHACTQLGLRIDCGNHSVTSTKMKVKNFGLSQATNGHYLLPVSQFEDGERVDIPEDFSLREGEEAQVLRSAAESQDDVADDAAVMLKIVNDSSHRTTTASALATSDGNLVCLGERWEEARDMRPMRRSRSPSARMPNAGSARRGGRGRSDASGCRVPRAFEEDSQLGLSSESGQDQGTTSEGIHGAAFDYGVGSFGGRSHQGRDCYDHQETNPPSSLEIQEGDYQGLDGRGGRLSQPVARVVAGSGDEHGVLHGFEDEGVHVEEVAMAASSEGSQ